jgi:predicted TIM-barrel fold metal-dependent hydrolase
VFHNDNRVVLGLSGQLCSHGMELANLLILLLHDDEALFVLEHTGSPHARSESKQKDLYYDKLRRSVFHHVGAHLPLN